MKPLPASAQHVKAERPADPAPGSSMDAPIVLVTPTKPAPAEGETAERPIVLETPPRAAVLSQASNAPAPPRASAPPRPAAPPPPPSLGTVVHAKKWGGRHATKKKKPKAPPVETKPVRSSVDVRLRHLTQEEGLPALLRVRAPALPSPRARSSCTARPARGRRLASCELKARLVGGLLQYLEESGIPMKETLVAFDFDLTLKGHRAGGAGAMAKTLRDAENTRPVLQALRERGAGMVIVTAARPSGNNCAPRRQTPSAGACVALLAVRVLVGSGQGA